MIITGLFSLAVGLSVGWTGIGGFLLLILFSDFIGLTAGESLFYSFTLFLLEGLIGSYSWIKKKAFEIKEVFPLCLGSLVGSICGAWIGSQIDGDTIKIVLYITVLISGLSILFRDLIIKENDKSKQITRSSYCVLGVITALICSISGAGGPVLVIPILLVLGMESRKALAVAITDSIFISIPAIIVYGRNFGSTESYMIFIVALIFHFVGLIIANKTSDIIKASFLKYFIAIFSIAFSIIKVVML